jgi:hypothetical protein
MSATDPQLPVTDSSIFNLIRSHLDPVTGRLDGALELPDEEAMESSRGLRFAAGAADGIATHHMGFHADPERAAKLAEILDRAARGADGDAVAERDRLLGEGPALDIVDALISQLAGKETPVPPLQSIAHELATRSRDRDRVKIGIALLGATGATSHEDVVMTLGRHDEFTLYAAVALDNMLQDPQLALWDLARHVEGWGRIQAVERMVPATRVEVQRWLRTEGFSNSVMPEYLALIAAREGKLLAALERHALPAEELTAACDLISVLIEIHDGGPAPGIDSYSDAAAACLHLLRHLASAEPELQHLVAMQDILGYVERVAKDPSAHVENGWTESTTAQVLLQARELAGQVRWRELVREHLDGSDERLFQLADRCAGGMGLDPFPWHWKRLQASPLDSSVWFRVMTQATPGTIDEILALATRSLPLEAIATGPGDELGLGKAFEAHGCLDCVLQDLKRFPGKGHTLILAGLRSPVVRNRHMALGALEAWDPAERAQLRDALERARQEEIDEKVRSRIAQLLA